jgi:fumarate reductase subunit D
MMLPIILLVLATATPFGLGARLATSRRVLGRASHVLERRWLVLMGELIDVGGYRLYCHCQGAGGPTVIMDSGLNQPIKA